MFSSPEALLRSPYYPGSYPKNRDCIYIISQPVSKAIRLDFQDFDIEGSDDVRCYFDFLEVSLSSAALFSLRPSFLLPVPMLRY
jgi:hypothetical protein